MGEVYRAFDRRLQLEVVVKFPIAPEGSPEEAGFLERFRREPRALVRLRHPHVVKVLDAGEDGGLPYLVMPTLERREPEGAAGAGGGGRAPADAARGRSTAGSARWPRPRLPPRPGARPPRRQAGQHLLRPRRPCLSRRLRVIKVPGDEAEPAPGCPLTTPGYLVGTPSYVAPELVLGRPADGRGDQYALALWRSTRP